MWAQGFGREVLQHMEAMSASLLQPSPFHRAARPLASPLSNFSSKASLSSSLCRHYRSGSMRLSVACSSSVQTSSRAENSEAPTGPLCCCSLASLSPCMCLWGRVEFHCLSISSCLWEEDRSYAMPYPITQPEQFAHTELNSHGHANCFRALQRALRWWALSKWENSKWQIGNACSIALPLCMTWLVSFAGIISLTAIATLLCQFRKYIVNQ